MLYYISSPNSNVRLKIRHHILCKLNENNTDKSGVSLRDRKGNNEMRGKCKLGNIMIWAKKSRVRRTNTQGLDSNKLL